MAKPAKTLGMRVLEGHGVTYRPVEYAVEEHLSAPEVAAALGLDAGQTFKLRPGTLTARPRRSPSLYPAPT